MVSFLKSFFFRKRINPARRIVLGFAFIIFIGAVLLMLPVSSRTGEFTPFVTALFTATSATCVTGLSLVDVGSYFNVFGQAVILALIQIGGLGFIMVLCGGYLVSRRRINMRNRMMIAQSIGSGNLSGVVKLAKHVIYITAAVEGIGALILAVRFIPRFGALKGAWFGIFHSVSAFCNAGFDIIGDGQSVFSYRSDYAVLLTIAALIITGGLGFVVWEELLMRKKWKRLSMYTKVVLLATAALIVIGAAVYFAFEYNNPDTLADKSIPQKVLAAFFQSVTTRTAGFDALWQNNLTDRSKAWGIVLMMIGGASGSTAGGVKVGTIVLIAATIGSVLKAQSDIVIYGRRIRHSLVIHAMALLVMWLVLTTVGAVIVSVTDNQPVLNALYETASAYSTVGLSVGISASASLPAKLLLILYMFFGRVGIMTISVVFMVGSLRGRDIRYPDGDFIIG